MKVAACMLPKRWKNTCPFLASVNKSLVIFLCAYCHLVVGTLCTYYAASHPLTPHGPVCLQISIPDFPETDLKFICVDVYMTKVLSCSWFLSYMECLYISHAHTCKCAVISVFLIGILFLSPPHPMSQPHPSPSPTALQPTLKGL